MPRFLARHRLQHHLSAYGLGVLWLAVLVFTAWQGVGWFWHFKQPPAVVAIERTETDPVAAARRIESRHLFGEVPSASASGAESMPANVSSYTLLGVAAHSGTSPGFAVLREQGGLAQGYIEGETIAPGVRLVKIQAESVEIDRNGVRETVRLTTESAGNRSAPSPVATYPQQMRTFAPPPPGGMPMPQRAGNFPVPQDADEKRNEMLNSQ